MVSLLFIVLVCLTNSQKILEWQVKLTNPVSGKKLPVIIHYPSDKTKTYPIIVFNHGWTCKNTWYDYVWQQMVPRGYIVAMPGDDETDIPTENIFEYSAGQRYVLDWIKIDCPKDSSCPIKDILGNKYGASGHSMGGGATILSIANYPVKYDSTYYFDAAFTLSGCNPNNKVLQSCKDIVKPVFFLTGSHDCICPPDKYADKYYKEVPSNKGSCKYLGDITNGTHCNFEDTGILIEECEIGEFDLCPFHPHNRISNKVQWNITGTYMAQFFQATLYDDNNSTDFKQIDNMLSNDVKSGVMDAKDTQTGCTL
eukprot:432028_1